MFAFFKKKVKEPTDLEKELSRLYGLLATTDPDTPEYAKVLTYIGRLTEYQNDARSDKIKKEVWVNAGAQLLGVGFVVGAESIGTKLLSKNALGMLPKNKF